MQQIDNDPYRYSVASQERITLAVVPIGVGKLVTVNIDAVPQPKPSDLKYAFNVTKPSGRTHSVLMEFSFPGITDPTAKYQVTISATKAGQASGGPFSFSVLQTDPDKEAGIEFEVA